MSRKVKRTKANLPVTLDPVTNLVRVDGVIIGQLDAKGKPPAIVFRDKDRLRSKCRGSNCVRIGVEELGNILTSFVSGVE